MVRFENVTKKYSSKSSALEKISLTIENGEFVFLVGPSGSGKTTFLRLITRELVASSGKVYVDDWEIGSLPHSKIPQLRRRVGMIFQDFKVLSDRTVFENVALALEILNKPKKEIQDSVSATLALVGLQNKKNQFPAQLSAGELQRVSIARCMVGKPATLLADEPTGNLDPKTGWDIIKILGDVNKLGTTVITATHNSDIVNTMKQRGINLKNGQLISDQKKGQYAST